MSIQVKDASGNNQTVNTLPAPGQAASAGSLPVVLASDQPAVPVTASALPLPAGAAQEAGGNLAAAATALGAPADAAWSGTGAGSHTSLLKAIWAKLAGTLTIGGSVSVSNLPGTQPVSGSVSVSNLPATQPISATALPLPSGAATDANLTAVAGAAGSGAPALSSGASGFLGWLRKIVDTLTSGFSTAATDAHLTNVQSAPGTAQTTALTVQGNSSGIALPAALSASDPGIAAMVAAQIASTLTPPIQMRAQSQVVTDLAAGTILTTSGTGSAIALDSGNTYGALINVTAASGTNPTLDLILQESFDGGTTFKDIYMVLRIKAAGVFYVPTMLLTGQRRWRWAISGTTPSFTLGITATRGTGTAQVIRNFYDYTQINPNTLGSKSPTWDFTGCKSLQLTAFAGAGATTNAVFQIILSPDGSNWATTGSTINPGPNSVSTVNAAHLAQFAGATVATAGVAETLNYINLYGIG